MADFIQNILWNSVSGFVEAGTRTAGQYAGDALIKAGDMVENGGRGLGDSIERKASAYSTAISGQAYQPSAKALPSTARKPVIKRSNSTPTPAKTPMGASKYPGGKPATGAPTKKQITSGVTGAKSSVGSAKHTVGSTVNGAAKGLGGVVGGAQKTIGSTASSAKSAPKSLPKPYSSSESPFPTEKKTAVKPGQSKPFNVEKKDDKMSPYPGTNTLPGQGGKTPVKPKTYKPMPRMAPPADRGKVQHIAI